MNTLEKRVTAKKARIARLDQRIGALMSQRVTEEEKLATLLGQQWPAPITNPAVTGGGQPFRGSQQVILEKRTPDGKLDFSGEQPPAGGMTFDELWNLYLRTNPKDWDGSWSTLKAWLDSKGWVVRAKTW
jgi:hypothetical protein